MARSLIDELERIHKHIDFSLRMKGNKTDLIKELEPVKVRLKDLIYDVKKGKLQ